MNADVTKRKNLGRGLNALFGEQDPEPASDPPAESQPKVASSNRLPVELLSPSPFQPRRHFDESALDDLARSIGEKGVLQPLLVRADSQRPGHYEIIAGERRWRAAQRAQIHEVPVLISELSDVEVLEVALIENLQREDLSPVEEARGYRRLLDEFSHTQEQLGEAVGKSRAHIANTMRLLALPESVLDLIERGQLTAGQARPLIGLADAEAVARNRSPNAVSARVRRNGSPKASASTSAAFRVLRKTPTLRRLRKSLAQATGYKVNISLRRQRRRGHDRLRHASSSSTTSSAACRRKDGIAKKAKFPEDTSDSALDDHSTPYPDPGLQQAAETPHDDLPST